VQGKKKRDTAAAESARQAAAAIADTEQIEALAGDDEWGGSTNFLSNKDDDIIF
jgi:hypothetical protein